MCRHTAWLGPPRSLQQLLLDPAHGLLSQSWQPRNQAHGTVNADGFGIGWFDPASAAPARYRRAAPMWADASLASFAGVVRSGCVLAAVRSATAGGPAGEDACAPFLLPGGVLLSHNGTVPVAAVAPLIGAGALAAIGSTVDSAFVAALVATLLQPGTRTLAAALSGAVRTVADAAPDARLNLLATDGRTVAATAWGDTLCCRAVDGGLVAASEPSDDGPGWQDVPDRSLLVLTGDGAAVTSLERNL